MYRRILVPIDGTPLADRSVEQALALARVHGAQLVFLHVHPDFASTEEGALLLSLAPGAFADGAGGRTTSVLARAEAAARAAKVAHRSLALQHDKPHKAIVDAAREHGAELIFMASHGRRGLVGSRLGNVTRKVLDAAQIPVLVAAVEVNLAMSTQSQALDIIRAEHRSLASVVHALQQHWQQVAQGAAEPNFELLRAMLYYIEHFPERLHHPKEEEHLFARLRLRSADAAAMLDRLEGQHREGSAQFAALRALLLETQAGTAGARERFGAALVAFIEGQWQHMSCEEQFVLPEASRWLTTDDWDAIAAAFGANGDPRFGADADEAFDQLAERLLRLAAAAPR